MMCERILLQSLFVCGGNGVQSVIMWAAG